MIIGFTGHRDCIVDPSLFNALLGEFPDASWCHGGAVGFDTQVNDFAKARDIPCKVFKPNFKLQRWGAGVESPGALALGCRPPATSELAQTSTPIGHSSRTLA